MKNIFDIISKCSSVTEIQIFDFCEMANKMRILWTKNGQNVAMCSEQVLEFWLPPSLQHYGLSLHTIHSGRQCAAYRCTVATAMPLEIHAVRAMRIHSIFNFICKVFQNVRTQQYTYLQGRRKVLRSGGEGQFAF